MEATLEDFFRILDFHADENHYAMSSAEIAEALEMEVGLVRRIRQRLTDERFRNQIAALVQVRPQLLADPRGNQAALAIFQNDADGFHRNPMAFRLLEALNLHAQVRNPRVRSQIKSRLRHWQILVVFAGVLTCSIMYRYNASAVDVHKIFAERRRFLSWIDWISVFECLMNCFFYVLSILVLIVSFSLSILFEIFIFLCGIVASFGGE